MGWEPASLHLFQISQSQLGIFRPTVSDWTICTNQRLERALPGAQLRPWVGPAPCPVSPVAMGTGGRWRGKAPDVRWGFNMAMAAAAVVEAQESWGQREGAEFRAKQLDRERLRRQVGRISGLARGLGWAERWRWDSVYASRGRGRWVKVHLWRVGSCVGGRRGVNAEGEGGI